MNFLKKSFFILVTLLLSLTLYSCNDNNLNSESLITNIDLVNNELVVSYLDNTIKNLGKPEKLINGNEVGVSEVTIVDNGELVAVLTNDEQIRLGYFVGSIGDSIELKFGATHIMWRFVDNGNYKNLIAYNLITGSLLRDNLDVKFIIEDNEIKWKNIENSNYESLNRYFMFASMLGLSNLEITSIDFNESNQTIITLASGDTITLDFLVETYLVNFIDENNNILKSERLSPGFNATPPEYTKEGYSISWDKDSNNINSNLDINVVLTPNRYQIIFNHPGLDSIHINFNDPIINLPVPVGENQTFIAWVDNEDNEVNIGDIFNFTNDITLTPLFEHVELDASYQVLIYRKTDNSYELFDTFTYEALAGDVVSESLYNLVGYHINKDKSVVTGTVLIDNSLKLKLYFDNNKYEIIFDQTGIAPLDIYYNTVITYLPLPEKSGYSFVEWRDSDGNPFEVGMLYTKTSDLELFAHFISEDMDYIVKTYLETLDGEYVLETSETFNASVGSTVNASKIVDGYNLNHTLSNTTGIVNDANTLELLLYFDLNEYTITFDYPNIDSVTIKHSAKITNLPIIDLETHFFDGWLDDYNNIIDNDSYYLYYRNITLTPKLTIKDSATYVENTYIDGELIMFSNKEGFVGEQITMDIEKPGYTYLPDISTPNGIVTDDNSLIVEVYFKTNRYNITFMDEEQTITLDFLPVFYNYPIGAMPVANHDTLVFKHWVDENGNIYNEHTIFEHTNNIILIPVFEESATYSINFYNYSNINHDYNYTHRVEGTGIHGESFTPTFEVPYGYELNDIKTGNTTVILDKDFNKHINIYFRYKIFYAVYYEADGSVYQTVGMEYQSIIGFRNPANLNIPEGYEFSHWELFGEEFVLSDGLRITQNLEFRAILKLKNVIYYVQNNYFKHDSDNNPRAPKRFTYSVPAFTNVTHMPTLEPGYEFIDFGHYFTGYEATVGTTDGKILINFFYREVLYEANFLNSDGSLFFESTGIHTDPFVIKPPTDPELTDHNFIGWLLNGELVTAWSTVKYNKNYTFKPLFDLDTATYYVDYYFENISGNFSLGASKEFTGIVGHTVSAILFEDLLNPPVYDFGNKHIFDESKDLDLEKTLASNSYDQNDGSLIATRLKVYYKYIMQTVNYHIDDLVLDYTFKYNTLLQLGENINDDINDTLSLEHLKLVGWVFGEFDEPELIINDYRLTSNINLYAVIEPIKYKITFIDGNNQTEEMIPYGKVITPNSLPTVNGDTRHEFIGWIDEDGDLLPPTFSFNSGKNITLYAKWHSTGKLYEYEAMPSPNDEMIRITSYLGRNSYERIPYTINNIIVKDIYIDAFRGNPYLEHLEIGNNNVWSGAFSEMPKLKFVSTYSLGNNPNDENVPGSSVTFDVNAFKDNPELMFVDFSKTTFMTFGESMFEGNTNLQIVILPIRFNTIPKRMFYNASSLELIIQPGNTPSLTTIDDEAFYGTTSLKRLVIYQTPLHLPNGGEYKEGLDFYTSLYTIGKRAFENSGLEELVLPNSVNKIDHYAFKNTKLTEININSAITEIGDQAFFNLRHLESINIVSTVSGGFTLKLGQYAFGDHSNTKLEYVILGANVSTNSSYTPFAASNILNIFIDKTELTMSTWGGKHNVYLRGEWDLDDEGIPFVISD